MNSKLIAFIFYLLLMWGFGFIGGMINYEELEKKYNKTITEYEWKLESCYQQIGDMQDDYDVNNDGVVDAVDYVAIKKYIMDRDE